MRVTVKSLQERIAELEAAAKQAEQRAQMATDCREAILRENDQLTHKMSLMRQAAADNKKTQMNCDEQFERLELSVKVLKAENRLLRLQLRQARG